MSSDKDEDDGTTVGAGCDLRDLLPLELNRPRMKAVAQHIEYWLPMLYKEEESPYIYGAMSHLSKLLNTLAELPAKNPHLSLLEYVEIADIFAAAIATHRQMTFQILSNKALKEIQRLGSRAHLVHLGAALNAALQNLEGGPVDQKHPPKTNIRLKMARKAVLPSWLNFTLLEIKESLGEGKRRFTREQERGSSRSTGQAYQAACSYRSSGH